jgi:DNA-binding NtrC family response regulator
VKSKQKLIYIIDDEEDNLEIISGMIKNQNYRYECFLSAQEAFTRSEESPPDLVLTDMRMPGLSGIDVLKNFKQIDSEISIIFLSGYLDKTTLMEALNLGVFAVIDKPIKEIQLNSYIAQALARREMWRILNKSIDLILFQINDMGNYLISQNKSEQLEIMKQDARQLLESRRALKAPRSI